MKLPPLSIVIPAYNESERLGPTLAAIRDYSEQTQRRCEVIVVDDGSTDDTANLVRAFEPRHLLIRLLASDTNHGKGHAVRQGMVAATCQLILMCDADLSTPLAELEKLETWLDRGFDIAIGSRDLPESELDPPQPAPRRLLAGVFRAIRRTLLLGRIRDTQCGFKLFRQTAARDIFSRLTTTGWLFDCEALALAQRLGYRIKEVGVTWRNDPDTRVRVWIQAFTAVPTLIRIRQRLRRIPPRKPPALARRE